MKKLEVVCRLKLGCAVMIAVVIVGGVVARAVDLSELGKQDDKGRYVVPTVQVAERFSNPVWCALKTSQPLERTGVAVPADASPGVVSALT